MTAAGLRSNGRSEGGRRLEPDRTSARSAGAACENHPARRGSLAVHGGLGSRPSRKCASPPRQGSGARRGVAGHPSSDDHAAALRRRGPAGQAGQDDRGPRLLSRPCGRSCGSSARPMVAPSPGFARERGQLHRGHGHSSGNDVIDVTISTGPDGTCACKMSTAGGGHLAPASPDLRLVQPVPASRLTEAGVRRRTGDERN